MNNPVVFLDKTTRHAPWLHLAIPCVVLFGFTAGSFSQKEENASPILLAQADLAVEETVIEENAATKESAVENSEMAPAAEESVEDTAPAPVVPKDDTLSIKRIEIVGDIDLLDTLGMLDELRGELEGKHLSHQDIRRVAAEYNDKLIERGYYLAALAPHLRRFDEDEGKLTFVFDAGRMGKMAFFDMLEEAEEERQPFSERFFSISQIKRKITTLEAGDYFNYNAVKDGLFQLNSHPDLTLDTYMMVRREREESALRKYVDMDFEVKERFPLHTVLTLNNYGMEMTDDWRVGLTLQYLNVSKRDDVFTLRAPFSLDFESIKSFGLSYVLPNEIGQGGNLTVYGGYSKMNAEDILNDPDFPWDIRGDGWYAGLSGAYNLYSNPRHDLKAYLGIIFQDMEETYELRATEANPTASTIDKTLKQRPVSLSFAYTSIEPDMLGGRNFLTSQTQFNFAGFLGGSEDDDFSKFIENAEADYVIQRLQYARIQPFAGTKDGTGRWIVFIKADGQYAGGTLTPSEQKHIGGATTVRGYEEREFVGDHGVHGNLEIRTPILLGPVSQYWVKEKENKGDPIDKMQLVTFIDGGFVKWISSPIEGDDTALSESIFSGGAGIRLGVTSYAQIKFDWGFPFTETEDSDHSGRGSVNVELQF